MGFLSVSPLGLQSQSGRGDPVYLIRPRTPGWDSLWWAARTAVAASTSKPEPRCGEVRTEGLPPLPEPGARFFWKVLPSHQLTWNLTFGGSGFGPFSFQRTSGSMCIGGSGQEVSKTKGLILLEFWNNSQIASGWVCQ